MKLKKYKEPKAENAKYNIAAHSGLWAVFAVNTIPHIVRILLNNYACALKKGSYNKVIGFRLKGFDSEMMYYILTIEISTEPKNILITEVFRTTKKDFKSKLNRGFFEPIQPLKKEKLPQVITDVETFEEKQKREKKNSKVSKAKKTEVAGKNKQIEELKDLIFRARNYIVLNSSNGSGEVAGRLLADIERII